MKTIHARLLSSRVRLSSPPCGIILSSNAKGLLNDVGRVFANHLDLENMRACTRARARVRKKESTP